MSRKNEIVIMAYEAALAKAWEQVSALRQSPKLSVKFLADEYEVDFPNLKILSLSCNILAKDYLTILILHYLAKKLKGLAPIEGNWISFKELPGGEGYYAAFRKRSLLPIIRKYGRKPEELTTCLERLPGKMVQYGDCAVVLGVFEGVPVMVSVFGEDEEFSAEANMLFDRTINQIFCTEDIAVLSAFIASVV